MALKYTCDRCGGEISGYSPMHNKLVIERHFNQKFDGMEKYEPDLCQYCIEKITRFIDSKFEIYNPDLQTVVPKR